MSETILIVIGFLLFGEVALVVGYLVGSSDRTWDKFNDHDWGLEDDDEGMGW